MCNGAQQELQTVERGTLPEKAIARQADCLEQVSAVAEEPRDALCVTHVVLQTKVDAHCDKLATVVGRINLTTITTIDVA